MSQSMVNLFGKLNNSSNDLKSREQKEINMINRLISNASKKGYLYKLGGTNRTWKKRWFCLCNKSLYYFENSQETKLLGKFDINRNTKLTFENPDPKIKKEFGFAISQPPKPTRYIAAENEGSKKEWMTALESAIANASTITMEGFLWKQGPKGGKWNKRYCLLENDYLFYYKQQKDFLPAGMIALKGCLSVSLSPDIKPGCFAIEHPSRTYFFYAELQPDTQQWYSLISNTVNCAKPSPLKVSSSQPPPSGTSIKKAEVFLSKPLKEGILNKVRKQDTIKKTKPIRLVLTSNFIYYFPLPNSTEKYHSLHLPDCKIEEIPPSMGKVPNAFRVCHSVHPLYLGAEDEKEYKIWLSTLETVKQKFELQTETKTDDDIKTSTNIDYSIEIINEFIESNQKEISSAKKYNITVKAFWTEWKIQKSYQDFIELYIEILEQFPHFILPKISEIPLYTKELGSKLQETEKPKGSMFGSFISSFRNDKQNSEVLDKDFDLNYLRAVWKEILRNRSISQFETVLEFFKLNNIFYAIETGELAFVRYFLDQRKENLNVLNEDGSLSPLQFAAQKGFKQIVESLVNAGANPNFPNKRKLTAVSSSVESGNKNIFLYLLSKGGDLNTVNENGRTLLHLASMKGHIDIMKELFSLKLNINLQDKSLRTPLHLAAIDGQLEAVRLLVEQGANLEITDEEGFTPLLNSCWQVREEVVFFLLEKKANVHAQDKYNRNAVHLCALRGDKSDAILKAIIDAGAKLDQFNSSGSAAIHLATKKGYASIVEVLIAKGGKKILESAEQKTKQTILHLAVINNRINILETVFKGGLLLVNVPDANGKCPLHFAIELGNIQAVQILLRMKANVELQDNAGDFPIHIACSKGYVEIAQLLVQNNSLFEGITQKEGYHPIFPLLQVHCAVLNNQIPIIKYLITVRCNIRIRDSLQGNTPLHLALMKNNIEMANFLLENGAELADQDFQGRTPLYYVPQSSHQSLLETALKFKYF